MNRSLLFGCLAFTAASLLSFAQSNTVPPEMVGAWSSSEVRTSQFKDRATGAFSRPTGTIIKYRIFPDGQYKQDTLIQTSLYNCTDVVFASESGRVVIDGQNLIFETAGGNLSSQDNCNAGWNYKKQLPARRHVYSPWLLRNGQSGPELCMADEKNNKVCYRRDDQAK